MNSVKTAIEKDVQIDNTYYWTGSKVCLSWINSEKSVNVFAHRRVQEIKRSSNKLSWCYCESENNPNDLLIKTGFPLSQLKEKKIWWEGPNFFNKRNIKLNSHENISIEFENFDITETPTLLVLNQRDNDGIDKIIDTNKFSNLSELHRTTAWVKRFCVNLKNIVNNRKETILLKSFLKSSELCQAENDWIEINQKTLEDNNKLKDLKRELNVIVDNENLLRCEGRLQYAPLPYDSKTPILLNDKHKIAMLLVKNIHECYKHIGLKHTLTELRQRFWGVRGRNFVRGVLKNCLVYRRFEGKTYRNPITPPQTPFRLNLLLPPGLITLECSYMLQMSDKTYKAWVTLYTCAASRAIILDLTPGMDSSVLKRSIKRFINCRGCLSNIISGNGKNFISQETGKFITSIGIEWHFNLPSAPWHGGFLRTSYSHCETIT